MIFVICVRSLKTLFALLPCFRPTHNQPSHHHEALRPPSPSSPDHNVLLLRHTAGFRRQATRLAIAFPRQKLQDADVVALPQGCQQGGDIGSVCGLCLEGKKKKKENKKKRRRKKTM